MNYSDTIVALATASGAGAVAIIRVSGKEAIAISDHVFKSVVSKKSLKNQKTHTIHLGHIVDEKRIIDEVLVSVFKNPKSYTGEDVVEIQCHGSIYIQQEIIQLLLRKGCRMADAGEFTLRAFLNGKLDELPGEKPNLIDWENHLTTIFPEVRLKSFLEMRGADGGGFETVCALSAFWVGLLYDSISLNSSWDIVKNININELQEVRIDVAKNGLNSIVGDINIGKIAIEILKISSEGLKRRNILNSNGDNEAIFLDPLENILSSGKSASDNLIQKFSNNWDKNLVNMYKEYTF